MEEKEAIKSISFSSFEKLLSISPTRYEVVRSVWKKGFLFSEKVIEKNEMNGFIVFTNFRLIFIERRGVFTRSYHCRLSLNYENIVGVSSGGWISKYISLIDQNGVEHRFSVKAEGVNTLTTFIQKMISYKKSLLEEKEKVKRVQVVLDFSFLRSVAEKGGIILTTISCPYCGGFVDMPASGQTFQCKYCQRQIYATDVFSKIKDLLKSLAPEE